MENRNSKIKFVFFGTPEVSKDTLEILKEKGFIPSFIVTSLDKPQGRKMIITPPPVKVWAEQNKIPYIQPEKLSTEEIQNTLNKLGLKPDLFIVVAYGKIMPEDLLNLPRLGSINVHYSLLPKYRGASPVESAILNGETESGVSIQKMAFKMDTGPIIVSQKIQIEPDEKAIELKERLTKKGGDLLIDILNSLEIEDEKFFEEKMIFQNESEATYCKKIKKEDGLIDLNDNPQKNYNKFRAYSFWPRVFYFVNQKRIIITDANLKDNRFVIKKVLPEGKKEISYEQFSNSHNSNNTDSKNQN